jgi:hypothetical protein
MIFEFSALPLQEKGYSERAMTILNAAPSALLAAIMEVALLETGDRACREQWLQRQLRRNSGSKGSFAIS